MDSSSPLAVLRVDSDGRVTAMSPAAQQWLGAAEGRPCLRVVAAQDSTGGALCREGCATALARGASTRASQPQARVRGRISRVECQKVGNEVVVVIEPRHVLPSDRPGQLSPREREALSLVAQGMTSREIAARLGLQPSTVRTHLEHARERLGARSRAEAVARWLMREAVSPPAPA